MNEHTSKPDEPSETVSGSEIASAESSETRSETRSESDSTDTPYAAPVEPVRRAATARKGRDFSGDYNHVSGGGRKSKRSAAAGWAFLLALVALGVAGFSAWQTYQWHLQNGQLSNRISTRLKSTDDGVRQTAQLTTKLSDQVATINQSLDAITRKLDESEGYRETLQALSSRYARSQDERILAEIEQVMMIADQQLKYAGNIDSALYALKSAQTRLEQPDVTNVRLKRLSRSISEDVTRLQTQRDELSIPETVRFLNETLENVDRLPLLHGSPTSTPQAVVAAMGGAKPADKPAEGGVAASIRSVAGKLWQEFLTSIRFESLDPKAQVLMLSTERVALLREHLKIRLLSARVALLVRDTKSFQGDLQEAHKLLEGYYNGNDPGVRAVKDKLTEIIGRRAVDLELRDSLKDLNLAVSEFIAAREDTGNALADVRATSTPAAVWAASAPATPAKP